MDELEKLAKPLSDYLRENYHPHTSIIVTDERVTVLEDVFSIPFCREKKICIELDTKAMVQSVCESIRDTFGDKQR